MTDDVKQEEKQAEKPLDKMTVIELREVAKEEIPGIVGVTGMKKEELQAALREARGITDVPAAPKKKKKIAGPKKDMSVKEMKEEIANLRSERETLRRDKDKQKLEIIRRRINRLKKMTRRVA